MNARLNGPLVPTLVLAVVVLLIGAAIATFGAVVAAVVPAVLGGAMMLVQPLWGLLAVFILVPIEHLLVFSGGTAVKAMAAVVAIAWVLMKLFRGESFLSFLQQPPLVAAMLFVGYSFLSSLWAVVPVRGLARFAQPLLLLGLCVMTMDLARRWSNAEALVRALVVGGLAAASVTLGQYLLGDVRRAGDDVSGGINATAWVLVTLVPLGFQLLKAQRGLIWRVCGLAYVALASLAVLVTFSRMALLVLGLLVAVEYVHVFRSGRGKLAIVGLTIVALGIGMRFVPADRLLDRVESIVPYIVSTLEGDAPGVTDVSPRGFHIRVAVAIFEDHPIFGAGFQAYGPLFLDYQHRVPGGSLIYESSRSPHGTLWGTLANLGLVGLTLLAVFVTAVGRECVRAVKSARSLGRTANEYLLVRAIVLSMAVQLPYLLYADIHRDKLPWLVLGLILACHAMAQRAVRARVARRPVGASAPEHTAAPQTSGSGRESMRGSPSAPRARTGVRR